MAFFARNALTRHTAAQSGHGGKLPSRYVPPRFFLFLTYTNDFQEISGSKVRFISLSR